MELEYIFGGIVITIASCAAVYYATKLKQYKRMYKEAEVEKAGAIQAKDFALEEAEENLQKYKRVLSQKKSSETRLGQISENLVPFLDGCPYTPKDMHFMGNPIDYLVFDLDDGKIVFLEVKSGNSRASKRQKTIKNLIQAGRVYYEELRINEKGIKTREAKNVD